MVTYELLNCAPKILLSFYLFVTIIRLQTTEKALDNQPLHIDHTLTATVCI